MSAAKRAASLLPQLTRGFRSSAAAKAGKDITHEHIAYGAPHHGNPPGYTYVSSCRGLFSGMCGKPLHACITLFHVPDITDTFLLCP